MSKVQPQRRSYERWSPEETNALIQAWAPLYIRGRACSSGPPVNKDWSAVVSAVNEYRATTAGLDSRRTRRQCKRRLEHLRRQYEKGLAPRLGWPFFSVLHAVWADEVGDRGAGAVEGCGAPAGYDGAAAGEGSGDAEVIMKLAEEVGEAATKLGQEVGEVVTKLGGMYKDIRIKTLDVEREKAAVGHAGAGRRA